MKKKLRALTLMIFIGGSVLFAQEKNASNMIENRVAHMAKELKLSPEQRDEVYAIHMKYADRMMALRHSDNEKASKKEKRMALKKDIKRDLKKVLSPQQMKQAEAHMDRHGIKADKRFSGKRKHMQHMAKELDLSDSQRKEMRAIHKRQMEGMRAIKVMDISKTEKKTRRENLKKEMRKSYEKVLNKQQLKKFRAMRKLEHKKGDKNWAEPAR